MTLCFSSNTPENEIKLMPLIIKNLQDNGGELTKQELEKLIANESDEWQRYVNHKVISKKRHNEWKPFYFTFNNVLKRLELTGYLEYKRLTPVNLTLKGLKVDLADFNPAEVREISLPLWREAAERNRQSRTANGNQPTNTKSIDQENLSSGESEECNNNWREDLKTRLKNMDPYLFESFCRGLLRKMGITIDDQKGIKKSNDGGIDGYGYSVNTSNYRTERVALQCKRFNEGQVGSKNINELKGAIDSQTVEYGIFITTSSYSKAAREMAQSGRTPITLIDGDDLVDLIVKFEYKVHKVTSYIPDDSEIWGNEEEQLC